MLHNIHLKNFKASLDVNLKIAPLTVLSGLNGSGKSSILQAISMLKQSYDDSGNIGGLLIAGELIQLGQGSDVLSEGAENDIISIEIIEKLESLQTHHWSFDSVKDAQILNLIAPPPIRPKFIDAPGFQFLQANRIVPETLYPQSSHQTRALGFLGVGGEFTVDYLSYNANKRVSENRMCDRLGININSDLMAKASPTKGLVDQVSAWLQQLSPGSRISTEKVNGTDSVRLQYNYVGRSGTYESDKYYRPTNVGFGLTYSLPIIVACLSAPEGSLLLLENPEAHLHPQGQAALGELLAKCSADGVQVIVETHSDHLLNGIRIASKNGSISKDDVALHFFNREIETGEVKVKTPELLDKGRLSYWPKGFFDEWENSLDNLME
jgi:predicted ATPase